MVLDVIAKASVILAVASVIAAMLRRASASARHLVWTLGLVGALTAPALAWMLPRWELPLIRIAPVERPVPSGGATSESVAIAVRPLAVRHASTDASRPTDPAATAIALPAAVTSPLRSMTWRSLLFIVWLIGAAAVVARVLVGLAAVQWMTRRTSAVTDAPWLAFAQALAASLGLRRVRFLRTETSTMPMAWGIVRGSVLMPSDADRWPSDRLRIVLLHELAHVKRRDCLTHLVAQLACAAYWFNPLAWMAARRLRSERERACDDLVLAAGTHGPDYADQLLEIARVMNGARFPAVLAGASLAMAHRSQLEGRLMAILDPTVPRRSITTGRAVIASAFFAALLVSVASVQPWAEASVTRSQDAVLPAQTVPQEAAAAAPAPTPTPAQSPAPDPQRAPVERGPDHGIAGGVAHGIAKGVTRGVDKGVTEGIAEGIATTADGIVDGIANGIADSVGRSVGTSVGKSVARGVAKEMTVETQESGTPRARRQERGAIDPRTINALIEALKDTDKDVRETAMNALSQMRDPRVFDPLVAALKDAAPDVRQQAAFGLGQLRDARAIDPLAAALKDTNANVREQAAFALGQLRAGAAIDALGTALHDSNASVREQAAFALGQIRDPRAVDPLTSALKDENANVRQQAAFALGQVRDGKAVEPLVIALKDSNVDVREQAAWALGQLRDPRAIDGLTVALKDTNASVRQQAAFALGQIR